MLLVEKYENGITNTWNIPRDTLSKSRIQKNCFPNRLIINKSQLTDKKIITEKFNKVSVDVGMTLATKIPKS